MVRFTRKRVWLAGLRYFASSDLVLGGATVATISHCALGWDAVDDEVLLHQHATPMKSSLTFSEGRRRRKSDEA